MLITGYSDLVKSIVESTYQSLKENQCNKEKLCHSAILTSKLSIVNEVNNYMLFQINSKEKEYLSLDSICKISFHRPYRVELLILGVLNGLQCLGLPNHKLKLKVGVPIMLITNIDQSVGLGNGIRLVVI